MASGLVCTCGLLVASDIVSASDVTGSDVAAVESALLEVHRRRGTTRQVDFLLTKRFLNDVVSRLKLTGAGYGDSNTTPLADFAIYERRVHESVQIASSGQSMTFLMEMTLDTHDGDGAAQTDSEEEAQLSAIRRRQCPIVSSSPIRSLHVDFLHGERPFTSRSVDSDALYRLAHKHFAVVADALTSLTATEIISDAAPALRLYQYHTNIATVFTALAPTQTPMNRAATRLTDGITLFYHHVHIPTVQGGIEVPQHLFFAPNEYRFTSEAFPTLQLTHSLLFAGARPSKTDTQQRDGDDTDDIIFVFRLHPPVLCPSPVADRITSLCDSHSQMKRSGRRPLNVTEDDVRPRTEPTSLPTYHAALLSSGGEYSGAVNVFGRPMRFDFDETIPKHHETAILIRTIRLAKATATVKTLSDITCLLKQQIIFNEIYASAFLQHPAFPAVTVSNAAVRVPISAFPPNSLKLTVPSTSADGKDVSFGVDVRITELSALNDERCERCSQVVVAIDGTFDNPAPCTDRFARELISATMSLPILVDVIRRRHQQATHKKAKPSSSNAAMELTMDSATMDAAPLSLSPLSSWT